MSDMPPSPGQVRIMTPAQAAAYWTACENRDEDALARWLDDSEDNRAAWRQAGVIWTLFDNAGDDAMIAAMARAARQAGPESGEGFGSASPWLSTLVDVRLRRKWLAAAAVLFIVASGIVLGLQPGWFDGDDSAVRIAAAGPGDPQARFGTPDYVTSNRQNAVVDLPDGTRVMLDPDSALDVAYGAGGRHVRLVRGHGYFDVARDAARRFDVEAAGRLVTALGTRFDVELQDGRVRVVPTRGGVEISSAAIGSSGGVPVRLHPGRTFTADRDEPGAVGVTDPGHDVAAREGLAVFDDQPLSVVVDRLDRTTLAEIVIRSPEVAALRVTGQFRIDDLGRFAQALEHMLPVRMIDRGGGRYVIVPRNGGGRGDSSRPTPIFHAGR